MKSESTTHKAEGLLGKMPKAETQKAETSTAVIPQLAEEQLVIDGMMQCLRSLKRSALPGVAHSAREWERVINYRIQISLQERVRRAKARVLRLLVSAMPANGAATSTRSVGHTRPGVSPNQD